MYGMKKIGKETTFAKKHYLCRNKPLADYVNSTKYPK